MRSVINSKIILVYRSVYTRKDKAVDIDSSIIFYVALLQLTWRIPYVQSAQRLSDKAYSLIIFTAGGRITSDERNERTILINVRVGNENKDETDAQTPLLRFVVHLLDNKSCTTHPRQIKSR